jgi:Tfp pilus assembly protein PilF
MSMTLVDRDNRMAWRLPSLSRTGNPFPPDDSVQDCPVLGLRVFWHPSEARLALVLSEEFKSTGARMESVRSYDLTKDLAAWTSFTLAKPKNQRQLDAGRAEISRLKEVLAATADAATKAEILCQIGDFTRAGGDLESAAGYYDSSLDFDPKNQRSLLGRAHLLLAAGKGNQAKRLARKVERADSKKGALSADLGLFHIAAGDLDGARPFLQAVVDADGGASLDTRLRIGLRILDADLAAGLAYMQNLYEGIDDAAEVDSGLLAASTVRVTEASIHLRDLPSAASYLSHLDPKATDTMRLALMIGALRQNDARAMTPILNGVDALLDASPGACDLYYVKGMAYLQLTRAEDANVHLAAAVACDPSLEEAHYYLADMYRFAGRLSEGRRHYERYLALTTEQRGDEARTLRRAVARTMVTRMAHTGAILIRWDCDARDRVVCRGVVFNSSPAPTGAVPVALIATGKLRRKETVIAQSSADILGVDPGQSVNFLVQLPLQDPGVHVHLEVGRSEVEKKVNRTPVH